MTGRVPPRAITRRTLLLAGAGAAAAASIPNAAVAATKRLSRRTHLIRSTWEPLVGTVIETRNPGFEPVPLLLVSISDSNVSYGQTERFREGSFMLVFRGPADKPLDSSTHVLSVPDVGNVRVWFSNASLGDDGWTYVAVFSNSRVGARRPRTPRGVLSQEQRREIKRRRRKAEKGAERARRAEREREKQRRLVERAAKKARRKLAKSS
jgi:hypothetical protein